MALALGPGSITIFSGPAYTHTFLQSLSVSSDPTWNCIGWGRAGFLRPRAGRPLLLFQPASLVLRKQIKSQSSIRTPLESPRKSVIELGLGAQGSCLLIHDSLEGEGLVGPSNLTELDV